ncbi:hypothetical protein CCACVL1_04222 [Corchorus capsularis]|uniref:Transmembrane protein n=1 Tax=Corchorus capsularis TaxID=210143 RepID=A0A1R3JUB7_COCAP|nr:hypothetical protein CCACVL1_04222 [Corchorus capsularis]
MECKNVGEFAESSNSHQPESDVEEKEEFPKESINGFRTAPFQNRSSMVAVATFLRQGFDATTLFLPLSFFLFPFSILFSNSRFQNPKTHLTRNLEVLTPTIPLLDRPNFQANEEVDDYDFT